MNGFGVGMQDDPQFQELVETLNVRHGLEKMPIIDTYLFRAPVREDANQFMSATLGEIGLPAIRMHMEENLQGMPVLCVMAQADNQPKLNAARNAFEGGGILVLEDVDLWGSPLADAGSDDMGMFAYAQLSRGAREAINLIRSAVENPEVYVLGIGWRRRRDRRVLLRPARSGDGRRHRRPLAFGACRSVDPDRFGASFDALDRPLCARALFGGHVALRHLHGRP